MGAEKATILHPNKKLSEGPLRTRDESVQSWGWTSLAIAQFGSATTDAYCFVRLLRRACWIGLESMWSYTRLPYGHHLPQYPAFIGSRIPMTKSLMPFGWAGDDDHHATTQLSHHAAEPPAHPAWVAHALLIAASAV
jgi:hypothetical protein